MSGHGSRWVMVASDQAARSTLGREGCEATAVCQPSTLRNCVIWLCRPRSAQNSMAAVSAQGCQPIQAAQPSCRSRLIAQAYLAGMNTRRCTPGAGQPVRRPCADKDVVLSGWPIRSSRTLEAERVAVQDQPDDRPRRR